MDKESFLSELVLALDCEQDLHNDMMLNDLEEWDSLGILSTIELIERCNSDVDLESIKNAKCIKDLIYLAGIDNG